MKNNELQVARDHLLMCQRRLEIARSSSRNYIGVAGTFSVIDRYNREADVLRALDWVWEVQERAKRTSEAYFGIGAITADEAREMLLERVDSGYYDAPRS